MIPNATRVGEARRRLGAVEFWTLDRPATFIARARGYIGPLLLLEDLRRAAEYGRAHPEGWTYVAEVSSVRLPNPVNGFLLRRIKRLPNIRRYVVVTPSRFLRAMGRFSGGVLGQDAIVRDIRDAVEGLT